MKLPIPKSRPRRRGMISVVYIALLGIMLVFVMVEAAALARMHREGRMLQEQQIKRLNCVHTNAVPAMTHPAP